VKGEVMNKRQKIVIVVAMALILLRAWSFLDYPDDREQYILAWEWATIGVLAFGAILVFGEKRN
jgi:hypothetical protein